MSPQILPPTPTPQPNPSPGAPHLPLLHYTAGYWVIDTPGQPIPLRLPLQLDLLSVKNERLTVKVPNLRAQDLGVNFKS